MIVHYVTVYGKLGSNADDSSATGNLTGIHKWWTNLLEIDVCFQNPTPILLSHVT